MQPQARQNRNVTFLLWEVNMIPSFKREYWLLVSHACLPYCFSKLKLGLNGSEMVLDMHYTVMIQINHDKQQMPSNEKAKYVRTAVYLIKTKPNINLPEKKM